MVFHNNSISATLPLSIYITMLLLHLLTVLATLLSSLRKIFLLLCPKKASVLTSAKDEKQGGVNGGDI
jgi:hypothetical protein